MPLYEYRCDCGSEFDRYLPVSRFDEPQVCECGATAKQIISSPMLIIAQDICYDSPIDGRPITTLAARREDLARSGCTPYDPGIRQDYHKRIERGEKELEKSVEETIEREISTMPSKKLEKLQRELDEGVTAEPVRTTAPAKPIHTEIEK